MNLKYRTFFASFSTFKRSFSSFFRFSAEYSFFLFSSAIFSSNLLAVVFVFCLALDCPPIIVLRFPHLLSGNKKKLRDEDEADAAGFSSIGMGEMGEL